MTTYTRAVCVWLNYSVEADSHEEGLRLLKEHDPQFDFNRTLAPDTPFSVDDGPTYDEWLTVDGLSIIETRIFDDITPERVAEELGYYEEEQ